MCVLIVRKWYVEGVTPNDLHRERSRPIFHERSRTVCERGMASKRDGIGQHGPAQRESQVRSVVGCNTMELWPLKLVAQWLDDSIVFVITQRRVARSASKVVNG